MKLKIQQLLHLHGLQAVVDDLHLICKKRGNLILLKYNSIESDYSIEAVQECRGLILDRSKAWKIVSYSFSKFFNIQEGHAAKIDWSTAKIFKKNDGSLIHLAYYEDEKIWLVNTSGNINGECRANDTQLTFNELFWQTVSLHYKISKDEFIAKLDTKNCYSFEIMTPYNIVVTSHRDSRVVLLAVRDIESTQEYNLDLFEDKFICCERYSFMDLDTINKTFEGMSWEDEGYVVCDANFNRVKIKNPAYVQMHHLKGGLAAHYIMGVIKTNEVEEFCSYYKEREEEAQLLLVQYNILLTDLTNKWLQNLGEGKIDITDKDFALHVFDITKEMKWTSGLFFGLRNGKIKSVREWVNTLDDKFLYNYLLGFDNSKWKKPNK